MFSISDEYYEEINSHLTEKEKQSNWNMAFGLQAVDGLEPSEYMVGLSNEHVQGIKTYDEIEDELNAYYSNAKEGAVNKREKEADEVSLRIVKILESEGFSFSIVTLLNYHKFLFQGIDLGISAKYIGNFRDCNISKKEPVLGGKSVIYADWRMIADTLKYDFDEERTQNYIRMNSEQQVNRISEFTSRIWQVHPFREGNTRTTAVFIQKYLNSMGFDVNNDLFKAHSAFFRNALVKANYTNFKERISADKSDLINFFRNLLLGENIPLEDLFS